MHRHLKVWPCHSVSLSVSQSVPLFVLAIRASVHYLPPPTFCVPPPLLSQPPSPKCLPPPPHWILEQKEGIFFFYCEVKKQSLLDFLILTIYCISVMWLRGNLAVGSSIDQKRACLVWKWFDALNSTFCEISPSIQKFQSFSVQCI